MKHQSTFNYTKTRSSIFFDILPARNFHLTTEDYNAIEKKIPKFLKKYVNLFGESVTYYPDGEQYIFDNHFTVIVKSMDPKDWDVHLFLEIE